MRIAGAAWLCVCVRVTHRIVSIINYTSLPGDYENGCGEKTLMAHFSLAFQFIIVFFFQPFPRPSISPRAPRAQGEIWEIIHMKSEKEREAARSGSVGCERKVTFQKIKKGEFSVRAAPASSLGGAFCVMISHPSVRCQHNIRFLSIVIAIPSHWARNMQQGGSNHHHELFISLSSGPTHHRSKSRGQHPT